MEAPAVRKDRLDGLVAFRYFSGRTARRLNAEPKDHLAERNSPVLRTILLVDDHPVVALGLELAIRASCRFKLVRAIQDPILAEASFAEGEVDVAILDLAFGGELHLTLISAARLALPGALIVVFSSLPTRRYQSVCIAAGADAFVTKDTDLHELLRIVSELVEGADRNNVDVAPAGGSAQRTELQLIEDLAHLTPREEQVAVQLSKGLSISAIARELKLSANTVAVHRDNIRRKLGCRGATELTARLASLYTSHELEIGNPKARLGDAI